MFELRPATARSGWVPRKMLLEHYDLKPLTLPLLDWTLPPPSTPHESRLRWFD